MEIFGDGKKKDLLTGRRNRSDRVQALKILSNAYPRLNCCAQTLGIADVVGNKNVRRPAAAERRNVDKSVGTSVKNVRSKYTACEDNREKNLSRISSSERSSKIIEEDGQSRKFDRRLKCERNREDSWANVKCTGDFELKKKKGEEERRILDAVAGANIRGKNSFAEQETLELEAFVRSIVDREISRKCRLIDGKITASSETSSTIDMESSEDQEFQNSSSEKHRFRKHRTIRRRDNEPLCKKHFPRSPTTSLTSVRSRSGTPYFTASSKGKQKRQECKIHGNRSRNNKIEHERARKKLLRPRIIEYSDDTEYENKKPSRSIIDRRKSRRITRYRSSIVFTL